jgi:hypothetical protein
MKKDKPKDNLLQFPGGFVPEITSEIMPQKNVEKMPRSMAILAVTDGESGEAETVVIYDENATGDDESATLARYEQGSEKKYIVRRKKDLEMFFRRSVLQLVKESVVSEPLNCEILGKVIFNIECHAADYLNLLSVCGLPVVIKNKKQRRKGADK